MGTETGYFEDKEILERQDPSNPKRKIKPTNGDYAVGIGGTSHSNTCCIAFTKTKSSGLPKEAVYREIIKKLVAKKGIALGNIRIGQLVISGSAPTFKLNKSYDAATAAQIKDLIGAGAEPSIELDPRFDPNSEHKDDGFIKLLKLLKEKVKSSDSGHEDEVKKPSDELSEGSKKLQTKLEKILPQWETGVSKIRDAMFKFMTDLYDSLPPEVANDITDEMAGKIFPEMEETFDNKEMDKLFDALIKADKESKFETAKGKLGSKLSEIEKTFAKTTLKKLEESPITMSVSISTIGSGMISKIRELFPEM